MESTTAELEVHRATLEELNQEQEQLELEVKGKKKEQAVFTKEALLLDKKIAKKRGELDKKVGGHMPHVSCYFLPDISLGYYVPLLFLASLLSFPLSSSCAVLSLQGTNVIYLHIYLRLCTSRRNFG